MITQVVLGGGWRRFGFVSRLWGERRLGLFGGIVANDGRDLAMTGQAPNGVRRRCLDLEINARWVCLAGTAFWRVY